MQGRLPRGWTTAGRVLPGSQTHRRFVACWACQASAHPERHRSHGPMYALRSHTPRPHASAHSRNPSPSRAYKDAGLQPAAVLRGAAPARARVTNNLLEVRGCRACSTGRPPEQRFGQAAGERGRQVLKSPFEPGKFRLDPAGKVCFLLLIQQWGRMGLEIFELLWIVCHGGFVRAARLCFTIKTPWGPRRFAHIPYHARRRMRGHVTRQAPTGAARGATPRSPRPPAWAAGADHTCLCCLVARVGPQRPLSG